jgi:hypothetical protein
MEEVGTTQVLVGKFKGEKILPVVKSIQNTRH